MAQVAISEWNSPRLDIKVVEECGQSHRSETPLLCLPDVPPMQNLGAARGLQFRGVVFSAPTVEVSTP